MSIDRFVALALLCVAGSCSVSFPVAACWFTDSALLTGPETSVRDATLDVTADMGPLVLELAADVDQGSAVWSLVDPTGMVRWRCATGPVRHLQQRCELPALEGTWKVRREWDGFGGVQNLSVTSASTARLEIRVSRS